MASQSIQYLAEGPRRSRQPRRNPACPSVGAAGAIGSNASRLPSRGTASVIRDRRASRHDAPHSTDHTILAALRPERITQERRRGLTDPLQDRYLLELTC